MFYLSPKHHFDTMFVILCVIAGATSHAISNTSKTTINQSSNHHRASFIDYITNTSLIAHLLSVETTNEASLNQLPHVHQTASNQQPQALCAFFSNLLTGSQMKFCQRHRHLLRAVLPQLYPLTMKECLRISTDFKWNCSLTDLLLDKSSPVAFTREAALVKSILNASMMYLVVKTCSELNLRSCGCKSRPKFWDSTHNPRENARLDEVHSSYVRNMSSDIEHYNINSSQLLSLKSGTPLKLTKTIRQHQGCTVNVAFADAFTRVFIDSSDYRALNKANKILNEDQDFSTRKHAGYSIKLSDDSDLKDLARIKWGKAALNLHNSNLGRQLVREAIKRRCRCHGLSGICQFRTCWDYISDIEAISWQLRSIYIISSSRVHIKDIGTFNKPDLGLFKFKLVSIITSDKTDDTISSSHNHQNDFPTLYPVRDDLDGDVDDIHTNELIYLYDSPNYCDPLPYFNHPGTKDRPCTLHDNLAATIQEFGTYSPYNDSFTLKMSSLGLCEILCCKRGYRSQLVMELANCNCRFRSCCEVECDDCPRQRLQHFCL